MIVVQNATRPFARWWLVVAEVWHGCSGSFGSVETYQRQKCRIVKLEV